MEGFIRILHDDVPRTQQIVANCCRDGRGCVSLILLEKAAIHIGESHQCLGCIFVDESVTLLDVQHFKEVVKTFLQFIHIELL